MSIFNDLSAVMKEGRWVQEAIEKPAHDLNGPDLNHIAEVVFISARNLVVGALLLLMIAGAWDMAVAAPIADPEATEIANILYAEAASDPEGWLPKLNTYSKASRPGETLLKTMKRVSSAYRMKSPQYRLAKGQSFNAYELKIYKRIKKVVLAFRPDPSWQYVHHENFDLYPSREAALKHLRRAWGDCVDFKNCLKIGQEHYFKRKPAA